jgi:hypothetical protein
MFGPSKQNRLKAVLLCKAHNGGSMLPIPVIVMGAGGRMGVERGERVKLFLAGSVPQEKIDLGAIDDEGFALMICPDCGRNVGRTVARGPTHNKGGFANAGVAEQNDFAVAPTSEIHEGRTPH